MSHGSKTLPSYAEVLDYLKTFTNYERTSDYKDHPAALGTERIEELLLRLDKPHTAQPALHVAGTKGKGSIVHLTARLLSARGFKVGRFLSPHLESVRERIAIDGQTISEEDFCEAFARVQPAVESMRNHPRLKPPTYFETLTAMAFVAFEQAGVDVAVMEVGLGGRLDATNVSMPVVASAISTISLDHERILGNTLLAIAGEKAGILREDTTVILAPQEAGVSKFLREKAASLGCAVRQVGSEIAVELRQPISANTPEAPQRLDVTTWRAVHHDVPLPLLGDHQRANAGVAVGLVEAFLEWDETGPIDTASLRRAWRTVQIPARLEILGREPWVLLDGAHNAASAWTLAETIRTRFGIGPKTLVFAVNRDKAYPTMLRILAPVVDRIIFTEHTNKRCLPADQLREKAIEIGVAADRIEVQPNPLDAMSQAKSEVGPDGLVACAGSLYLAGLVRTAFQSEPDAH